MHQKMLVKQRVPVTNPKTQVEGEEVAQNSEMEVEELKWFEAQSQKPYHDLAIRSLALGTLLSKLHTKFTVPSPVTETKEEGKVLEEIGWLISQNNKIANEFPALEEAGKIMDGIREHPGTQNEIS